MTLKEPVNGAIHLFGEVLSIIGLILLLYYGRGSAWKIVSFSIYGATLIMLYNFSTLYHWIPAKTGGKSQILRKLDHFSIYLLIAGSYTPFCLVTLQGPWGWSLFWTIWALALAGVLIQSFYINVDRRITTAIYLGMGWMVVVAARPMLEQLSYGGLLLLLLGGILYSIGGVVYALKKPNLFKYYGFHELWHTFVLLASFCHYLAILLYVAMI
jgi:hemolysin III